VAKRRIADFSVLLEYAVLSDLPSRVPRTKYQAHRDAVGNSSAFVRESLPFGATGSRHPGEPGF